MNQELAREYHSLIDQVEKPIRDIMKGVWSLDFVVDTGHSCCGHIVAESFNSRRMIEKKVREYQRYQHRATLEIAYSLEERHIDIRDQFRNDLKAVKVSNNSDVLYFKDISCRVDECLPYCFRIKEPNLFETYNAELEEKAEVTDIIIDETESLLAEFWESVARVIKRYNPKARIRPIKGKNFREVINWAHWRGIFM